MTAPIPLRDYVVSGLVAVETVNALLQYGEPMVTEIAWHRWYRAWLRKRCEYGCDGSHSRVFGPPDLSPQFAAERLLAKLRGER